MRDIILGADRRIGECIKWQADVHLRGQPRELLPEEQHASL